MSKAQEYLDQQYYGLEEAGFQYIQGVREQGHHYVVENLNYLIDCGVYCLLDSFMSEYVDIETLEQTLETFNNTRKSHLRRLEYLSGDYFYLVADEAIQLSLKVRALDTAIDIIYDAIKITKEEN